jgi:hypothetical protein
MSLNIRVDIDLLIASFEFPNCQISPLTLTLLEGLY